MCLFMFDLLFMLAMLLVCVCKVEWSNPQIIDICVCVYLWTCECASMRMCIAITMWLQSVSNMQFEG